MEFKLISLKYQRLLYKILAMCDKTFGKSLAKFFSLNSNLSYRALIKLVRNNYKFGLYIFA